MTDFLKAVEAKKNENIPELRPGDTVNVHVKIKRVIANAFRSSKVP